MIPIEFITPGRVVVEGQPKKDSLLNKIFTDPLRSMLDARQARLNEKEAARSKAERVMNTLAKLPQRTLHVSLYDSD